MSKPFSRPLFLDTTVLSNYASTDSVDWLVSTFDGLQTVPAVKGEMSQGYDAGYTYLKNAVDVLEAGEIQIKESAATELQEEYPEIQQRLDLGEAEALVAALTNGGTLASDDAQGRSLASSYDVPVTGSIGLLVRGIVEGQLTVETADEWLTTWVDKRNYFSPVESVMAVLPDGFEK
jgi:predicted nucleic acid-binding protein